MVGCGPVDESEMQAEADVHEAVADPRKCGNPDLDPEVVAELEARFEALKAKQAMAGQVQAFAVSIPTWFHIIRDSSGAGA
ncbi:hypothetical protein ACLESD_15350 [Pyxidicoccus sp. 3LFB2]